MQKPASQSWPLQTLRTGFSKSLQKTIFNYNVTMLSEEGVTLFDVLSVLQVGLIVTTTQLIRCVGSNEDLRLPDPRRLGGRTHYQGIAIPYLHHLRKKKKSQV